jgi:hypothetical protein
MLDRRVSGKITSPGVQRRPGLAAGRDGANRASSYPWLTTTVDIDGPDRHNPAAERRLGGTGAAAGQHVRLPRTPARVRCSTT